MKKFLVFILMAALPHMAQALPAPIPPEKLQDMIQFSYASTDGSFQLNCTHWIYNRMAGDFDVVCGKGTKWLKEFSVHLLIRTVPTAKTTSFEIIYLLTDRNSKGPVPRFSSHSQLFTVDNTTSIKEFNMSLGVENDYAQLTLKYQAK